MLDRPAIRQIRVDDFDLDLARKDNLAFANRELAEAGAHLDAAAVDERDAFAAFAAHDSVVGDLDTHTVNTLEAARYAVTQTTTKYVTELTGSDDTRQKIISDFTDSTTLSKTPLINLTYDNPPAPASTQNNGTPQLPPGVARRLGNSDTYAAPYIPMPKHDQGTPAPGEPVTIPKTSPGAPPPAALPPAPGEPLPGG